MIPLALASICGLVASISDLAGILLCFVVPVIAYAAIVVVKVRARLGRRRFREDEPIALAVLDEATFLGWGITVAVRSEAHTSELQSRGHVVCRLLREMEKL